MPSTYIISTGDFYAPDGSLLGVCYAGHPPHVNDISAVNVKNIGPLPPGSYRMGTAYNNIHTGPLSIPLIPLAEQTHSPEENPFAWLHGRNDFYIHGDSLNHPGYASDGCIVASHEIRLKIVEISKNDPILKVHLYGVEATRTTIPFPTPTALPGLPKSNKLVSSMPPLPTTTMELARAFAALYDSVT